jgi:type II secretory pathway component GspD/PulD (secretin)
MSPTLFVLASALFFGSPEGPEQPKPVEHRLAQNAEAGKMTVVTYSVADLVVPVEQAPSDFEKTEPAASRSGSPQRGPALEEALLRLIVGTIEPASWSDRGGSGTINYFPLGNALVVHQTPEVQEQIADMLEALRRLQDLEVAVEIRLVSVTQEFFDRMGKDLRVTFDPVSAVVDGGPCVAIKSSEGHGLARFKGMSFLNDQQHIQFMNRVQEDPKANTMQAPKLTLMNGQRANLDVADEHTFVTDFKVVRDGGQVVVLPKNETITTGVHFQVQPVISADRRYVSMNFSAKLTDLDAEVPVVPVTTHLVSKVDKKGKEHVVPVVQFVQQPTVKTMSVRKSFVVADGKTAILNWGTRMEETRDESGVCPAILEQIPYVGQLFSSSGKSQEAHVLLLLITPHVIINHEASQECLGQLSRVPR